jgi:hypothetical protein
MSIKSKLRARIAGDADKTHCEEIIFLPMSGGHKDIDRPSLTIKGVVQFEDGEISRLGGGKSRDFSASVAGQSIIIRLDLAKYAALQIRKDDRFQLIDQPAQQFVVVSHVFTRGARIIIEVVGK